MKPPASPVPSCAMAAVEKKLASTRTAKPPPRLPATLIEGGNDLAAVDQVAM